MHGLTIDSDEASRPGPLAGGVWSDQVLTENDEHGTHPDTPRATVNGRVSLKVRASRSLVTSKQNCLLSISGSTRMPKHINMLRTTMHLSSARNRDPLLQ